MLTAEQAFIVEFIGAADPEEIIRERRDGLDWRKLLREMVRHRVFHVLYRHLGDFVPEAHRAVYEGYARKEKLLKTVRLRYLENLLRHGAERGWEMIVVKGFVLSRLIYGDLFTRDFNDVDVIVPGQDKAEICAYMTTQGFCERSLIGEDGKPCAEVPDEVREAIFRESVETPLVDSQYGLLFELKTAPWELIPFIKEFRANAVAWEFPNSGALSFNHEHTFIYACLNAWTNLESEYGIRHCCGYRDIYDLYGLIRQYAAVWDMDRMVRLCEQYDAGSRVATVVGFLQEIYGGFDDLAVRFAPFGTNRLLNWQIGILDRLFNADARNGEYRREYMRRLEEDSFINRIAPDHLYRLEPYGFQSKLEFPLKYQLVNFGIPYLKEHAVNSVYGFVRDGEGLHLLFTVPKEPRALKMCLSMLDTDCKTDVRYDEYEVMVDGDEVRTGDCGARAAILGDKGRRARLVVLTPNKSYNKTDKLYYHIVLQRKLWGSYRTLAKKYGAKLYQPNGNWLVYPGILTSDP
ncbi:MAG TPA: hypothetical protein DD727_02250 [Clostridiales bacterium]|nr:hypothetical protein [Clostridiales bacterium]